MASSLMLLSALANSFFNFSTSIVHHETSLSVSWLLAIRSWINVIILSLTLASCGQLECPPGKDNIGGCLSRGIFGALASVLQLYAVSHWDFADASIVQETQPAFVALITTVVLGERWTRTDFCVTVFLMIGTILVVRPPILFESGSVNCPVFPVLAAFAQAFCQSCVTVLIKGTGATPLALGWWAFSFGGVLALVLMGLDAYKGIDTFASPTHLTGNNLNAVVVAWMVAMPLLALVQQLCREVGQCESK